ncbi:hypothetical protein ACF1B0_30230 [Streptomyces anandii]|uniref:ADP-ribosylglycohydrolase family protein n=1 Tax=Streptomyces anandii TaxID=285454 RepID=UPI0036F68D81
MGDALGAPFEFGPPRAFSARFPDAGCGGGMRGGGGWEPGEVTGGLAGAYHGLDAIPSRWTEPLHVPLPGFDGRVLRLAELTDLAHRLDAGLG